MHLTLEAHIDGGWTSVAILSVPTGSGSTYWSVTYEDAFAFEALAGPDHERFGNRAVGVNYPVDLTPSLTSHRPGFVDDVRPSGAAERWWRRRLGIRANATGSDVLARLLEFGVVAPVGNLRVRESVEAVESGDKRFDVATVTDRETDFLDYAALAGASVGGATGAGGEAPKLLLRVTDDDQVWIDAKQEDPECPDAWYLVKFARNRRTERDQIILESEGIYCRVAHELGFDTIDPSGIRFERGEKGPSLWLPRFDVERRDGRWHRLGLESLYSVIEAPAGSFQKHETYLRALHTLFARFPDYDPVSLTAQYVC